MKNPANSGPFSKVSAQCQNSGLGGGHDKNKINDLYTLTGYSGALIANGNFQRRPPHSRVKLGCQILRKFPRFRSR
jgi:hypothetical protein